MSGMLCLMSLIRWLGSFLSIGHFLSIGLRAFGAMSMPRLGLSCRLMRMLPVSRRFPHLLK